MKQKLLILISLCITAFSLNAQQVNTMYFMDNIPYRNTLNPAFQPYSNFYLGFPVLGYSQFEIGNNSVTAKDLFDRNLNYNLFGGIAGLLNTVKSNTLVRTDVNLNLLSFGFRSGKSYWDFSLREKFDGQLIAPKDAIDFAENGFTKNYDLTKFDLDFTLYTEAGLGYSRKINDNLSIGGKLKLLYGTANINFASTNLQVTSGTNTFGIKGKGELQISSPYKLIGFNLPTTNPGIADFLKSSGLGAGIDLGLTFKPVKSLMLSAAVTDLGIISWTNNIARAGYTVDYTYVGDLSKDSILQLKNISPFKNATDTTNINESYTTYTKAKINIGAEYGFFDNKLTLGLLSRTILHRSILFEELTASVNAKPIDWFNISASYSVLNGRMSNIGLGLGLRTGFMHWFVVTDYIPLDNANLAINPPLSMGPLTISNVSVPYNTKGLNFAFGVSFVFGNRKDADKDGVVDRKDKCPETPFSVVVDKKGCPLDTDGDGVPDYLDKCAKTPPEAYNRINLDGCPTDTDGDGVPDYLDKCPETPKEAFGFIDANGCSLDTDGDGVYDYLDKCANTPQGVQVDSVGCPLDTDRDGVPDYKDKCPDTVLEARNMVDSVGCPLDKDLDGVADYLDLCLNTPAEARAYVDKNGCTLDKDGDGVPDYLDKCPDTPIEARGTVDEKGCPRDTDGDGIVDYLDNCPKIPGVASNKGCPEIKKEVKALFKKALQGIQFETGKYVIKPISFKILDQVAKVLIENPSYLVEVQGHTDNVGKPAANMTLSDNRANAVKEYLIKKGVNVSRMTSHGYGDTVPVTSNKTKKGKALNRRVEFVVTFEETISQ